MADLQHGIELSAEEVSASEPSLSTGSQSEEDEGLRIWRKEYHVLNLAEEGRRARIRRLNASLARRR